MSDYRPIDVEAARSIADRFDKDIIAILAWDRAFNRTHTTTFGKTIADKAGAAMLGEILAKAAGMGPPDVKFEDFRTRLAAEWAREEDVLLARIRDLENAQYVPGEWTCDACGFIVTKNVINPASGQVGRSLADNLEACPNDGTALRRVRMDEACRDAREAAMKLAAENRKLKGSAPEQQ